MHALSTLLVVVAPVLVAAQNCPLQFDGRIPKAAKLGLLDTDKSPFNADYVKGAGEFWAFLFLELCFGGAWERETVLRFECGPLNLEIEERAG